MLIGENASEARLPGRGLSLIFVSWNEDGYSRPGTGKPLAQAAEMLERQWMWEEEIRRHTTRCGPNSGPVPYSAVI